MARGSTRPCQTWHRCRRFWNLRVECPYHGKSPEEEKKRKQRPQLEPPDEEVEIQGPKRGQAPARDRTGPRPPPFQSQDELVPVAVREPKVEELKVMVAQEEAFADVGIPLLPPAIGVPLYVPDEGAESMLPPGTPINTLNEIGVVGEEVFAGMIASDAVSKADMLGYQEEAFADVGEAAVGVDTFEGGNPAYGELGWLFGGLFAANAVAHLWQTFNANLSGGKVGSAAAGPKLSPVQTSVRAPPAPSQKVKPPKALPVPKAAPPRIPVGKSGGGGIGFHFQSNPGSQKPPLPQEEFNRVFQRTLDFPPVKGGGQDTD